ncbi:zinc finger protein 1 homolog [Ostrinia nubilalis]|uniref:zinc finger protein 1 homolog n=1 Tax=Ostrinia nubilalis TaxID=29057 RepID=UPI0030825C6D
MELENTCRCCLSQGMHKDLDASHVWLNTAENYSKMLNDCFSIVLSSSKYKAKICDACIESLRTCFNFKQQVLKSEQEFLKMIKDYDEDEKPFEIKLEPIQESGDDSDDYFLADAVRHTPEQKIKEEVKESPAKKKPEQKRKGKAPDKKSGKSAWRKEKIIKINKTLVNRLATSINSVNLPELTITPPKAPTKIKLEKSMFKDGKLNLTWTATPRTNQNKTKHRENLLTVLKFSNATPFKNKSLLGFSCGYCESTFPDPADLRSHTESSHLKERLDFKSNFDMTEYNVNLDITDLLCTLCDEKMINLSALKEHLVKTHNKTIYNDIKDHLLQFKLKKGEVYDCAMCTSTYETFKMLKQHMNIHYSNYTCEKCDTSFATKRSLNAHTTTHQEGSFKCDYCEKIFSSKPKKHYHEKTKHLGARNISNCPFCNEPFRSYYQRNQHMVKVHNSEAQYKCNICNKSYILKSLLMYHIKKNHLMERNCQCTECGYRFFSKKALKAHMVKHTGERIFACEVCNKSYARKYTLREHMRIHNNDRRFKCEVCAMTFVQKCSLKSHLLSNHGISMTASAITCS